jgi:hypothetical protein
VKDDISSTDSRSYGSEVVSVSEEETLVADYRATLTPSQLVEQKLIDRLKTSPLRVSHIQRRLKPGPR